MELISSIIALAVSYAMIIFFVFVAFRQKQSLDFYFASNSLNSREIRGSVAASVTSLAGVILFFLDQTSIFKGLVLFILIFTYFGYEVFLYIIKGVDPDPKITGTPSRFLANAFPNSIIPNIVSYVLLLQIFLILCLEIVLGGAIFSYFSKLSPLLPFISIAFIALFVSFYVVRGGLKAVVYTDGMQWNVIIAGMVAALFFLIVGTYSSSISEVAGRLSFFPELPVDLIVLFLLNVVILNSILPASQISTWQRYSSGSSAKSLRADHRFAFWTRVIPLWALAIFTAIAAPSFFTDAPSVLYGILDLLRASGGVVAMVIFPLVFMGLVAALISTVDTMFLAMMLQANDITGQKLGPKAISSSVTTFAYMSAGVLFVGASLLYFILANAGPLEQSIVNTLFICYGLSVIPVPALLVAAKYPNANPAWLTGGAILGIFTLLIGAIFSLSPSFRELLGYGTLAPYFGNIGGPVFAFVIVSAVSFLAILRKREA